MAYPRAARFGRRRKRKSSETTAEVVCVRSYMFICAWVPDTYKLLLLSTLGVSLVAKEERLPLTIASGLSSCHREQTLRQPHAAGAGGANNRMKHAVRSFHRSPKIKISRLYAYLPHVHGFFSSLQNRRRPTPCQRVLAVGAQAPRQVHRVISSNSEKFGPGTR